MSDCSCAWLKGRSYFPQEWESHATLSFCSVSLYCNTLFLQDHGVGLIIDTGTRCAVWMNFSRPTSPLELDRCRWYDDIRHTWFQMSFTFFKHSAIHFRYSMLPTLFQLLTHTKQGLPLSSGPLGVIYRGRKQKKEESNQDNGGYFHTSHWIGAEWKKRKHAIMSLPSLVVQLADYRGTSWWSHPNGSACGTGCAACKRLSDDNAASSNHSAGVRLKVYCLVPDSFETPLPLG